LVRFDGYVHLGDDGCGFIDEEMDEALHFGLC
jgi:hypothetical protein